MQGVLHNAEMHDGFEAQFFREHYVTSQCVSLNVAVTFCMMFLSYSWHTTLSLSFLATPVTAVISLALLRWWLHSMQNLHRAHAIGWHFSLLIAFISTTLFALLAEEAAPVFSKHRFLTVIFWIMFSTFAFWLQVQGIPLRWRLLLTAWLLVVNVATPGFSGLSEVEDFLALFACLTASWTFGLALESSRRKAFESEASERLGDSRLNHILKNKICFATFLLEKLADEIQTERAQMMTGNQHLPSPTDPTMPESPLEVSARLQQRRMNIKNIGTLLHQVAQWCHLRELFVQLQARRYNSIRTLTDMRQTLNRVVAHALDVQPIQLEIAIETHHLLVDSNVVALCMEEAVSNLLKYADPRETAILSTRLQSDTSKAGRVKGGSSDGVSSATATLVLELDSVNRTGVGTPDSSRHGTDAGALWEKRETLMKSSGVGLGTIRRSCDAAGGSCELVSKLDAHERAHTMLRLELPVEIPTIKPLSVPASPISPAVRRNAERLSGRVASYAADYQRTSLRRTCKEWSVPTRDLSGSRTPSHELVQPPAVGVGAGGGSGNSTASSAASMLAQASTTPPLSGLGKKGGLLEGEVVHDAGAASTAEEEDGERLLCIGVDDCPFMRQVLKEIFLSMGADADARSHTIDDTPESETQIVDHLLGVRTGFLAAPYVGKPADIVVLDENMNFNGLQFQGTSLARTLRERGFRGVICILSGESLVAHNSQVRDRALDAVLTKGSESVAGLARVLKALYKQKRHTMDLHASAAEPPRLANHKKYT